MILLISEYCVIVDRFGSGYKNHRKGNANMRWKLWIIYRFKNETKKWENLKYFIAVCNVMFEMNVT